MFWGAGVEVDGGGQDGGPSARVRAQGREVGDGARSRLSDEFERALQNVAGVKGEARGEGGEGLRERTGMGPEGGFASSARGGRA